MSIISTGNDIDYDRLLNSFLLDDINSEDGPVLNQQMIQETQAEAGCDFGHKDNTIYTVVFSFWLFFSEMVFTGKDRSTTAAVVRANQMLQLMGEEGCSFNNGRYCTIRGQFKAYVPKQLAKTVTRKTEQNLKDEELWNGRHVGLLDGSTLYMPDTSALQEEYPQSRSQKPGVGFPVMRIVAITSLATAMLHDLACGPWRGKETGEMALFRSLIPVLKNESNTLDLFVADRYFCTYFAFALLMQNDIDFLARLHHRRNVDMDDYEKVKKLPNGDLLVQWDRPVCPKWMDEETYATMPEKLLLRLVEVIIDVSGWRTEKF